MGEIKIIDNDKKNIGELLDLRIALDVIYTDIKEINGFDKANLESLNIVLKKNHRACLQT